MAGESCSSKKKRSGCSKLDLCNLYINGIWDDCTQAELDDMFKLYGVICQSRVHGNGIGFIRFEKPEEATLALSLNGTKPDVRCVHPLIVKHANKKIKRPKSVVENPNGEDVEMNVNENTKNVYFRGLPKNYKKDQIFDLCSKYGTITSVRVCKKNISFVRFLRGQDANAAVRDLHRRCLPGYTTPIFAKLANSDPFEPRINFSSKNKPNRNNKISKANFTTTTSTAQPQSSYEQTSKLPQYPNSQNENKNLNEIIPNVPSNNSNLGDVWPSPASMVSSRVRSNSFILSQTSQSPCTLGGINASLNQLSLIDNPTNSITSAVCPSLTLPSPLYVEQHSFQQSRFPFNDCYTPCGTICVPDYTNPNKNIFNGPILQNQNSCFYFPNGFATPVANTANAFPFMGNNMIPNNFKTNIFPETSGVMYSTYFYKPL